MKPLDHPAVADWMARFDRAARDIPEPRRSALRAELVEHLREAIPDSTSDETVFDVLDGLGGAGAIVDEEIAAAEQVEVEPRDPVGRTLLRRGAIVLVSAAVFLAVALPLGLTWLFAQPTVVITPNVVTDHPQGPERVTEGRAYLEYLAETDSLPPLPVGASWPEGVPAGLDAGPTDDGGVMHAGAGAVVARFTYLCAWDFEYLDAERMGDERRLVAALSTLQQWGDSSWWREVDPNGVWAERVLGPLEFADSSELRKQYPADCASAGIMGAAAAFS